MQPAITWVLVMGWWMVNTRAVRNMLRLRLLNGFVAIAFAILPGMLPAQTFVNQGPSPSAGPTPADTAALGGEYSGAAQAVLVDPSNSSKMYIGGVNGGVWVTTNSGFSWTPLTDNLSSLSIASLSYDPTDPSHTKIYAGVGLTSNGAFADPNVTSNRGGGRVGILYSGNGGSSWTVLNNGISGMSVVDVVARGTNILAATFEPQEPAATAGYGLYRSTDGGKVFTLQTGAGQPDPGPVTSLVGDSNNSRLLYTAVAKDAVYYSVTEGASWTKSTLLLTDSFARLATGPGGSVVAAIFSTGGTLTGLQLSLDSGVTWHPLAVPIVTAGGQALTDLAVAIDPGNKDIVYVAGDRGATGNSLGAFRVVWDPNTGTSYAPESLSGDGNTANGTIAHADARAIAFTSNGNMVVVEDAGVYVRSNPQTNAGDWYTLNTPTLALRESYAVAYDAISKRLVVAAQDTGTARQTSPGSPGYTAVDDGGGDGLNAVVNDKTLAGSRMSVVYETNQNLGLGTIWRWTYRAANNTFLPTQFLYAKGSTDPSYVPFLAADYTEKSDSGEPNMQLPFSSRIVLNKIDPTMIAFGTNYVYKARDVNASSAALTEFINLSSNDYSIGLISALAYGTRDNVNALLAGSPNSLFLSTTGLYNSLTKLDAYNALPGATTPSSVVFDLRTQNRFYVADTLNLWGTSDRGQSFSQLTGYLSGLNINRPTSVEFIANNGVNALLVGGTMFSDTAQSPIAVADSDVSGVLTGWRAFGFGLPNTIVNLMSYNDTADVLAISSFGRGVWVLYDVTSYFPQALVLRYGLADNDSNPSASFLTGARPLEKWGVGTLTINGIASYTGSTSINAGTLALVGSGSIASSSGVLNNGTFDISGTAAGTSITTLGGSGVVRLGSRALTISNGSDTFGGSVTDGGLQGGAGGSLVLRAGTQRLTGFNTYTGGTTVSGGTLAIGGLNPLGSGPVAVAAGATLMGTGTIGGAVTVAGTLKPGYSPGFLATNATVTMNPGSTYIQDIAGTVQATSATPAGSAGAYSSLQVNGGQFIIQPGANLSLRLANLFSPGEPGYGSAPYTPQLGDKFRMITADGGISGRFALNTQPAGLAPGTQLMPFYSVAGNNSLDLFAIPQSYSATLAGSANGNGRSVASALDQMVRRSFASTSTANQDQLLYAVAGQTASGLPSYATSLAGELYGASLAVMPQATQRVQQSVLARLGDTYPAPAIATAGAALTNMPVNPLSMEVMNGKTPGGPAPFYVSSNPQVSPGAPAAGGASLSSGAAWGEIAFQRGNRSGDDNASSFNSNLYQAVFGVDAYSEHGRKFGGGLAISTTSVWANGGTATVQQGALFLYGKLPLESWVIDGMASYGMNTTDNQRTGLTGLTDTLQAKGVRGNDALLSLGASRPVEFDNVRLTPYARLTWQQVSQSGFSEGSTPAALTVDRFNTNAVRGTLGLAVGSVSVNPMNDEYTYRGYIGVGADTPGLISPMLNASLAGISTTIATPSVGSPFVQAGLYATAKVGENAFGYLGVTGEARSGQTLAGIAAGVRIQF